MASDLQQKPAKFERFVEEQLGLVQKRIRTLDALKALLALAAVVLGYTLAIGIFDLTLGKSGAPWTFVVRYSAFGLFILGCLYYAAMVLVRLYRRINPYFVAVELEKNIGNAKNSVVNWLDLRDEALPGAIRGTIGLKAARDLKKADPDRVVDPKQNWFLGGFVIALVIGLIVLFLQSPMQFRSLVSRAFAPFQGGGLSTRTQITIVKPVDGNATVTPGERVEIRARVEGYVPRVNTPGAPTLHYRTNPGDPFATMPLVDDHDGVWQLLLSRDQVQAGLTYKVSAGDAETPEYQILVRSQPQVVKFEVTYQYRPYVKAQDFTLTYPNEQEVAPHLRGHRGTTATITCFTNRELKEGQLIVTSGEKFHEVRGQVLPENPKAFRATFVLEQVGQFRVLFQSKDLEANLDRQAYQIDVLADGTPIVELTKPGKDVELPANGSLTLEGIARDDFGIKAMNLKLRVGKQDLDAKPYRPGKAFVFEDGTYPDQLAYHDVLALDQVQQRSQPFSLNEGMIVEYWLEAIDNSDYPSATGNVGKSAAFKIKILAPKNQQDQQAERKKQEQQRAQDQKKQDQDLAKENQDRKDEAKKNEPPKEPTPEEQKKKDEIDNKVNQMKEDLAKKEKDDAQKQKGEAKGGDPKDADQKPDQKPDPNQKGGDQGKAEPKDQGAKNQETPGEAKDSGKKENQPGEAKGPDPKQNNPESGDPKGNNPSAKSEPKGQPDPAKDNAPSQAKDQGPKDPKDQGDQKNPAQAKDGGDGQKEQNPQAKDGGKDKTGPDPQAKNDPADNKQKQDQANGQNKPGDPTGQQKSSAQAKDQGPKDKGEAQPGQAKENGTQKPGADSKDPAQAKDNGQQPGQGDQKPAEAKDGGADKKGPQQQKDLADSKPGEREKADPSKAAQAKAKDSGPDPKGNENMGDPKMGDPKTEPKQGQAAAKDQGDKTGQEGAPKAQAKNEPGKQGTEKPSSPKKGDGQDPAQAKSDQGQGQGQEELTQNQGSPGAKKDAKMDEVGNLKDQMKESGDPGKKAEKDLAQIAKEAKDPDVRKAAQEALAQGKGQPKQGDGNQPSENTGPGGKGQFDDPLANNPNEKFGKKAGDLSLDKLKDKVTPDMLKKAGLSEKEWQQYLKDAQAYEEMLRRQKAQQSGKLPNELKGGPSFLPGQGPRHLNPNAKGPTDPLQTNQGQAPPGFREDYQLWTTKPK